VINLEYNTVRYSESTVLMSYKLVYWCNRARQHLTIICRVYVSEAMVVYHNKV